MVYLGADHGGFELKGKVKAWLEEWGVEVQDIGPFQLDPDDDYTDYASKLSMLVHTADDMEKPWAERPKGILLCRSGGGMIIAANRYANVRAVYIENEESAKHARFDNDANVVALAGDWVSDENAKVAVKTWLDTEFSNEERHIRRRQRLTDMGGGM